MITRQPIYRIKSSGKHLDKITKRFQQRKRNDIARKHKDITNRF
jgi:hypothetical protein